MDIDNERIYQQCLEEAAMPIEEGEARFSNPSSSAFISACRGS